MIERLDEIKLGYVISILIVDFSSTISKFLISGFGAKSAVAAAAIYITYDMGIWGTTDETQDLYNTACHLFGSPKPKRNDKWDPPSCEAESELFSVRNSTFNNKREK